MVNRKARTTPSAEALSTANEAINASARARKHRNRVAPRIWRPVSKPDIQEPTTLCTEMEPTPGTEIESTVTGQEPKEPQACVLPQEALQPYQTIMHAESPHCDNARKFEDSLAADIALRKYLEENVKAKPEYFSRADRALADLKQVARRHFLDEDLQHSNSLEFGRRVTAVYVEVFGSFHQGTQIASSDLDVAIVFELGPFSASCLPALWASRNMPALRRTFENCDRWSVQDCHADAHVPILKIIFENTLSVDVIFRDARDTSRNRDKHINTLITRASPIVSDLCLIAKHWAKVHQLNSAWLGGLNSVSWLMLVLCFVRQFYDELLRSQGSTNYSLSHIFVSFLAFVAALPKSGLAYIDQQLNLWIWRGAPSLFIEDTAPGISHNEVHNIASSLSSYCWSSIAALAGYIAARTRSGQTTVPNLVPLLFEK